MLGNNHVDSTAHHAQEDEGIIFDLPPSPGECGSVNASLSQTDNSAYSTS